MNKTKVWANIATLNERSRNLSMIFGTTDLQTEEAAKEFRNVLCSMRYNLTLIEELTANAIHHARKAQQDPE